MRLSALLLVAVSAFAAEIPQGAHVLLRMENSITTRTAKTAITSTCEPALRSASPATSSCPSAVTSREW
jgi:hypothetical protein